MAVSNKEEAAHYTQSTETLAEAHSAPHTDDGLPRLVFTEGEAENLAFIVATHLCRAKHGFLSESILNLESARVRALDTGKELRSAQWRLYRREALNTLRALEDLYLEDF